MPRVLKRMEPDDVRPDNPLQQLRTVRQRAEQLRPAWTSTSESRDSCSRLKLGHDVPLIHSNEWRENHRAHTQSHLKLKQNLKFDTLCSTSETARAEKKQFGLSATGAGPRGTAPT